MASVIPRSRSAKRGIGAARCPNASEARFDRQALVDRPDRVGRLQILDVHVRKIRLAPDVDLEKVAALTPGFTGADLADLVDEAALYATRRGGADVRLDDFTLAVERIVAGAADDLAKVTDIARSMVMRYGVDERLVGRGGRNRALTSPRSRANGRKRPGLDGYGPRVICVE